MKVKEVKFEDENCLIIYITMEEAENVGIIESIKEYSSNYDCTAVFVSGNEDTGRILKQILTR